MSMTREIKFRAKALDNTEKWIYGHYHTAPLTIENFGTGFLSTPNGLRIHCISTVDGVVYEVDIDTLGQYTGLKDRNRKEIYEGDIVEYDTGFINKPFGGKRRRFEIGFSCGSFLELDPYDKSGERGGFSAFYLHTPSIKVIGNIHENPELLK